MTPSCYIVGPADSVAAKLAALAREMGLRPVETYADTASAERRVATHPLTYFFFAPVRLLAGLRPVAASIRAATGTRFCPLIYFAETASVELIRTCAAIGFDDVITQPFTRRKIEERLERQVGRNLVYFETPDYFGPDRRDRLTDDAAHGRRAIEGEYRRFEIVRRRTGVTVLKDEVHVVV